MSQEKANCVVKFTIATLTQKRINITVPLELFNQLSCIFELNHSGVPLEVQTANTDFHTRLSELEGIPKEATRIIVFLKNIPIDEKFLWIQFKEEPDIFCLNPLLELYRRVHEINNIELPLVNDLLFGTYVIYAWDGQNEKCSYIGESNRANRVCRFCGKAQPEVSFRTKAHAISESLGNKKLFCNEECDACNEKFSSIEGELFNSLSILYGVYEQNGKNGPRSLKGNNISFDNKTAKIGNKLITINSDSPPPNNFDEFQFEIKEPTLTYSLQNIYKCICKFGISFIDNKYLNKLSCTIQWISSDEVVTTLPPIWQKNTDGDGKQPSIIICVRKEGIEDSNYPEFVVKLCLFMREYLFVFPFVDDQPIDREVLLSDCFRETFNLIEYSEYDYSSSLKQEASLSVTIDTPKGGVFINIPKNELEGMSDEERVRKYPHAVGFYDYGETIIDKSESSIHISSL